MRMRWSVMSERMCVGMRQWMESKYLNKTRLIDKKVYFVTQTRLRIQGSVLRNCRVGKIKDIIYLDINR